MTTQIRRKEAYRNVSLGTGARVDYVDHLQIDTADGLSVVVGELDQASTPMFEDAIASLVGADVVVDLSGLTFVDSMGLRALLRAKQARHGLHYVSPSPTVERIVDTTGLAGVLFADD